MSLEHLDKKEKGFPFEDEGSDRRAVEFAKVLIQEVKAFLGAKSVPIEEIEEIDILYDAFEKWPTPLENTDIKIDVTSGYGTRRQTMSVMYADDEIYIDSDLCTYDDSIRDVPSFVHSYHAQVGAKRSDHTGEALGASQTRSLIATAKRISILFEGDIMYAWKRQEEEGTAQGDDEIYLALEAADIEASKRRKELRKATNEP